MLDTLIVQRSEDDYEPLLTTAPSSSGTAQSSRQSTGIEDDLGTWCRGSFRSWRFLHVLLETLNEFPHDWWDITTSEPYLRSLMSRRSLWSSLMPIVWFLNLAGDFHVETTAPWIFLDACVLVTLLIVPHLHLHGLWPDIIVMAMFIVDSSGQFIIMLYSDYCPFCTQLSNCPDCLNLVYVTDLCFLFFFAFTGIHTSIVAGSAAVMLSWWGLISLTGASLNVFMCLGVVLAVFVSFAFEVYASWAFVLEEANKKLLDIGSDGFCTIDRRTGAVSVSSMSMQSLFSEAELNGKQLVDLVHSDESVKVSELVASSANSQAILVTCVAVKEEKVFECKIVPYTRSKRKLGLCFQIQGEKRFMATADLFQVGLTNGLNCEQQHNPDSECTFSLTQVQSVVSESACPKQGGSMCEDVGIQVQPSITTSDKATETLLTWGEHGFECKRCAKPPLPSSRGLSRREHRSPSSASSQRSSAEAPQRSSLRSHTYLGGHAREVGSERPRLMSNFEEYLPQASGFRMTPLNTCEFTIFELMQRWNCPRALCCPFHASVETVRLALKLLRSRDCNPLWSPLTFGQCDACGAMADEPDEDDEADGSRTQCEVCCSGEVIRHSTRQPDTTSVESRSNESGVEAPPDVQDVTSAGATSSTRHSNTANVESRSNESDVEAAPDVHDTRSEVAAVSSPQPTTASVESRSNDGGVEALPNVQDTRSEVAAVSSPQPTTASVEWRSSDGGVEALPNLQGARSEVAAPSTHQPEETSVESKSKERGVEATPDVQEAQTSPIRCTRGEDLSEIQAEQGA